ncbi:hypothetical protein [Streptomyces sp. NPDC053726]|uniref:hypothetical protein n=1 Tax=Streptomyces sp. NPDC053726 TaxID=3365713 RepID=UPI0037D0BA98
MHVSAALRETLTSTAGLLVSETPDENGKHYLLARSGPAFSGGEGSLADPMDPAAVGPVVAAVARAGLEVREVPGDGDCFMHALIISGELTGRDGRPLTAGEVRASLAHALRGDLALSPGQRTLWPFLDTQAATSLNEDLATRQGFPPGHPDHLRYISFFQDRRNDRGGLADIERRQIVDLLATPGQYNNVTGDLAPLLAALLLGRSLHIMNITPHSTHLAFHSYLDIPGTNPIHLIRHGAGTGHWTATRPTPTTLLTAHGLTAPTPTELHDAHTRLTPAPGAPAPSAQLTATLIAGQRAINPILQNHGHPTATPTEILNALHHQNPHTFAPGPPHPAPDYHTAATHITHQRHTNNPATTTTGQTPPTQEIPHPHTPTRTHSNYRPTTQTHPELFGTATRTAAPQADQNTLPGLPATTPADQTNTHDTSSTENTWDTWDPWGQEGGLRAQYSTGTEFNPAPDAPRPTNEPDSTAPEAIGGNPDIFIGRVNTDHVMRTGLTQALHDAPPTTPLTTALTKALATYRPNQPEPTPANPTTSRPSGAHPTHPLQTTNNNNQNEPTIADRVFADLTGHPHPATEPTMGQTTTPPPPTTEKHRTATHPAKPNESTTAQAGLALAHDSHFRTFLNTALHRLPRHPDTTVTVEPDTLAAAYAQLPPPSQDLSRPVQLAPLIAALLTHGQLPGLPGGASTPHHRPEENPQEDSDSDSPFAPSDLNDTDEEPPTPPTHHLALPTRTTPGPGPASPQDDNKKFLIALLEYKEEKEWDGDKLLQRTKAPFEGNPFPIGQVLYDIRNGDRQVSADTLAQLRKAGIQHLDNIVTKNRKTKESWEEEDLVRALLQYKQAQKWDGWKLTRGTTTMFKGRRFPIGRFLSDIRRGENRQISADALAQLNQAGVHDLDLAVIKTNSPRENRADEDFIVALLAFKEEKEWDGDKLLQRTKAPFEGNPFPIGRLLSAIRMGSRQVSAETLTQLKEAGVLHLDNAVTATKRTREIRGDEDFVQALLQYKQAQKWNGRKLLQRTKAPFEGNSFPIGQVLSDIRNGKHPVSAETLAQLKQGGVELLEEVNLRRSVARKGGKRVAREDLIHGRPIKRPRGRADATGQSAQQQAGGSLPGEDLDPVATLSPDARPGPSGAPDGPEIPAPDALHGPADGLDKDKSPDNSADWTSLLPPDALSHLTGTLDQDGVPGWVAGPWAPDPPHALPGPADGLDRDRTPDGSDSANWVGGEGDMSVPEAACTLTDPQLQALQEQGLQAVDVPHDGDCFFHALLTAEILEPFPAGLTPGHLREDLARELTEDLSRLPEDRIRWPLLDVLGQSAAAADEFRQVLTDIPPLQQLGIDMGMRNDAIALQNQILTLTTQDWSDQDRNRIIQALASSGVYDNASGDIAPVAAAWIYNLRINVITPQGTSYPIGPHNPLRELTLIRQEHNPNTPHDHWLATRGTPATGMAATGASATVPPGPTAVAVFGDSFGEAHT